MIGIYQIKNKINGHSYIGQSINIEKRWKRHISDSKNTASNSFNYPLQRAFRKYGIENFDFIVLLECKQSKLNDNEKYWIDILKPEYNQEPGGYGVHRDKNINLINKKTIEEIQKILVNDVNGIVSHKELAKKYGLHKDTIRNINVGRTWYNDKYIYPLHISQQDSRAKKHIDNYCCDCGTIISKGAIRCNKCESQRRKQPMKLTRKQLKELIRLKPFTTIASMYNVSDTAIRKWCDKYNLPRTKKEINSYSDEEWDKV